MSKQEKEKEINIDQVCSYLSHVFAKKTQRMEKAAAQYGSKGKVKSTPLYDLQMEMSYILDEIQRGPKCLVTHVIAKANEFLDKIEK